MLKNALLLKYRKIRRTVGQNSL